jgi:phosphatidate cytidylyltransferase
MKLSNFWQRLLTGIGFVGIISFSVVWSPLSCMSLFLIINIFCLAEFFTLNKLNKLFLYSGLTVGSLIYILFSFVAAGKLLPEVLFILFPVVFLLFIPIIFNHDPDIFRQIGLLLFGVIYISIPLALFIFSGFMSIEYHYSFHFLLAALILTWVNDTMAYVSGSLFGKHKFYEKLSPKKTWEGVAGGFIFTLLFSFVFSYFFKEISWTHWFFMSMIVSVFAFIGDLFESRIKRSLNIKDSGTFFPGHGGFLDRFDALLFVVPFYFLYIYFIIY